MSQGGLHTNAVVQDWPSFRSAVMVIDRSLHDEDVENMKFLCQGLLVCSELSRKDTAPEIITLLQRANLVTEEDYFLLADLLLYIGRVDVLENIGYDTAKVILQRHQQSSKIKPFFVLLFNLAEELTDKDVEKASAIYYGRIKRSRLQKLSSGLELFMTMMHQWDIRPEDVTCLITIFSLLQRQDLVEKINGYTGKGRNNFFLTVHLTSGFLGG